MLMWKDVEAIIDKFTNSKGQKDPWLIGFQSQATKVLLSLRAGGQRAQRVQKGG